MKIFLIIVAVLVAVALVGACVVVAIAVKECVLRPKNSTIDYNSLSERYKERYKIRQKNNQYLYDHNPEDLSLVDKQGNELKAWFVPKEDSKTFVICVHGYKCNGPDECSHLFPFYHNTLGFNYLLPDHVSHGRSEGKYISFGARESENLMLWINYLIERYGTDIEIVLHGISMGAATVMLVNESNPPEQVKAVIEDCGYTNAYEIIRHTIKRQLGFDAPHITSAIFFVTKNFFGYDMTQADCIGRMGDAKNPILFIHGTKDQVVPFEMAERLYESCKSVEKDKFFVENAIHAYSYYDAKEEYDAKVTEFLDKYLSVSLIK